MKIGARLGLGFAGVLVLLAAIAFVGITRLAELNGGVDKIANDRYPKTVQANAVLMHVNHIARAMRNVLVMNNTEDVKKELDQIDVSRAEIKKNLEILGLSIKSDKGKEMLKAVTDARGKYIGGQGQFIQLVADGKKDEARDLLLNEIT